ncbi:MAG TPA: GvpL/GvpF family gas vesicle protein [Vicinamibacterales bacterium]|nr:GvpL/GvpF family gas vesicle protein [Vicinamibacterales bacterium]
MKRATYVYGLVSSGRRPRLGRIPRGLPGAGPVRLLDLDGGLWLVVADVPLPRYSAATINRRLSDLDWVAELAVEHESVVEAFLDSAALLPMKLFTIFSSDERAVAHVAADRRRLSALLRRVAGRVEYGVRLVFEPAPARTSLKARAQPASGAAYLTRKKAERDLSAELAERARSTAAGVFGRLERRAVSSRRRTSPDGAARDAPLLLDATFLVPRARSSAFRAAAAREQRAIGGAGYRVIVSGPWPAYSFIQE